MESNDKMWMTILHPGLQLGVFVTWRDVSAMTGEAVLEEIMKVLQSNENFRINDGQMTIQVTVVRLPVGSGRKPLHAGLYFESENMSINKRSIIQINNTKDVMCMARAVVVAKCNADKEESETWKKNWHLMRQSSKSMQTREAMKLLDQAKIPHTKSCGIEEYKNIQSVLAPKYLIKVSEVAKIRNRYNQVPHLTQDTNGKVTNSQKTPQTRAKRSALSQQVKHI